LTVTARNTGQQTTPVGIGWHPYFNLPSGRRGQARLHVPSTNRALVRNYIAVLPTGEIDDVSGSVVDFSNPSGRALGDLYLDDCYLNLVRDFAGDVTATIADPAAGLCLRIASASPAVNAFQVYAPPNKAFVVVEPQFNLADPFGSIWNGRFTGMVMLVTESQTTYDARIEIGSYRAG
jgi:aldose 1-epimerase